MEGERWGETFIFVRKSIFLFLWKKSEAPKRSEDNPEENKGTPFCLLVGGGETLPPKEKHGGDREKDGSRSKRMDERIKRSMSLGHR